MTEERETEATGRRGAAKREKHYRVIDGVIYARVVYRDDTGKRVEKHYKAESKTHARELYRKKLQELTQHGTTLVEADRMTFRELAAKFKADRLQPAVYVGDTRVSGMASHKKQEGFLKSLLEYFGGKRVRSITVHDLEKYRAVRFATPTRRLKDDGGRPIGQRSPAHVNRELSLLRSIFNYAKRAGWIVRTPFESGKGLISLADENKRDRLLSRVEEAALLGQCVKRRAHLRPLITAALDTAMRKGELLALRWDDLDLDAGVITIRSTTTKTRRARTVGITGRLMAELSELRGVTGGDPDSYVFGGVKDIKNAFTGACAAAGISDLHFHDLRHVGTTRMIQAGMPPAEVMKITGHTQFATFARYVNVAGEGARRAAALLDSLHEREVVPNASELVN